MLIQYMKKSQDFSFETPPTHPSLSGFNTIMAKNKKSIGILHCKRDEVQYQLNDNVEKLCDVFRKTFG